jgi:hypothetical protein
VTRHSKVVRLEHFFEVFLNSKSQNIRLPWVLRSSLPTPLYQKLDGSVDREEWGEMR